MCGAFFAFSELDVIVIVVHLQAPLILVILTSFTLLISAGVLGLCFFGFCTVRVFPQNSGKLFSSNFP